MAKQNKIPLIPSWMTDDTSSIPNKKPAQETQTLTIVFFHRKVPSKSNIRKGITLALTTYHKYSSVTMSNCPIWFKKYDWNNSIDTPWLFEIIFSYIIPTKKPTAKSIIKSWFLFLQNFTQIPPLFRYFIICENFLLMLTYKHPQLPTPHS